MRTRLLVITFLVVIYDCAWAQRGSEWEYLYDVTDPEDYWKTFDFYRYFVSSIISTVVVILGRYLKQPTQTESYRQLGKVIEVIGYILAFVLMVGPIINGLLLLWRIAVGLAIFVGGIYWFEKNHIKG